VHDIQREYLKQLSAYIQNENETYLDSAAQIGKQLQGMKPEEMLSLHIACMKIIMANSDPAEAVHLYPVSFVFLMEAMVSYRMVPVDNNEQQKMFEEMRHLIFKSQHSVQSVKNKYENMMQHMDCGIAIFDQHGYLSFINIEMSKLLRIPRRLLVGCNLKSLLLHPSLKLGVRRMILNVYKQMWQYRLPFHEIMSPDGAHLLVSATYGEELNGDMLISVKDVTEFKRIEQTAYQNDKLAMLGKISAAIAHEIRNPLTSIRGFIQLLHKDLAKLNKQQYGEIILSEIDRANNIIHEFLNSSKPTSPVKQDVTVHSLLQEIVLLSESEAMLKGCMLENVPSRDDLHLWVDVKQIKQVLLNIVKNALDAIAFNRSTPGRITIRSGIKEQEALISITDNGPGMDQKTLAKLFEPFFTTKESGTGLGLSVCYRIIRNHGGTIHVKSSVGEGTEFLIKLPMKEAARIEHKPRKVSVL